MATELFIDDDADAEFVGLQNYFSEISPDTTVDCYLNHDENAVHNISKHDQYTFHKLKGGPERKSNSLRDRR